MEAKVARNCEGYILVYELLENIKIISDYKKFEDTYNECN